MSKVTLSSFIKELSTLTTNANRDLENLIVREFPVISKSIFQGSFNLQKQLVEVMDSMKALDAPSYNDRIMKLYNDVVSSAMDQVTRGNAGIFEFRFDSRGHGGSVNISGAMSIIRAVSDFNKIMKGYIDVPGFIPSIPSGMSDEDVASPEFWNGILLSALTAACNNNNGPIAFLGGLISQKHIIRGTVKHIDINTAVNITDAVRLLHSTANRQNSLPKELGTLLRAVIPASPEIMDMFLITCATGKGAKIDSYYSNNRDVSGLVRSFNVRDMYNNNIDNYRIAMKYALVAGHPNSTINHTWVGVQGLQRGSGSSLISGKDLFDINKQRPARQSYSTVIYDKFFFSLQSVFSSYIDKSIYSFDINSLIPMVEYAKHITENMDQLVEYIKPYKETIVTDLIGVSPDMSTEEVSRALSRVSRIRENGITKYVTANVRDRTNLDDMNMILSSAAIVEVIKDHLDEPFKYFDEMPLSSYWTKISIQDMSYDAVRRLDISKVNECKRMILGATPTTSTGVRNLVMMFNAFNEFNKKVNAIKLTEISATIANCKISNTIKLDLAINPGRNINLQFLQSLYSAMKVRLINHKDVYKHMIDNKVDLCNELKKINAACTALDKAGHMNSRIHSKMIEAFVKNASVDDVTALLLNLGTLRKGIYGQQNIMIVNTVDSIACKSVSQYRGNGSVNDAFALVIYHIKERGCTEVFQMVLQAYLDSEEHCVVEMTSLCDLCEQLKIDLDTEEFFNRIRVAKMLEAEEFELFESIINK